MLLCKKLFIISVLWVVYFTSESIAQVRYKVSFEFYELKVLRVNEGIIDGDSEELRGSIHLQYYELKTDGRQLKTTYGQPNLRTFENGVSTWPLKGDSEFNFDRFKQGETHRNGSIRMELLNGKYLSHAELLSTSMIFGAKILDEGVPHYFITEYNFCGECGIGNLNWRFRASDYQAKINAVTDRARRQNSAFIRIPIQLLYYDSNNFKTAGKLSVTFHIVVSAHKFKCDAAQLVRAIGSNPISINSDNSNLILSNDFVGYNVSQLIPNNLPVPIGNMRGRERLFKYNHRGGILRIELRTRISDLKAFVTSTACDGIAALKVEPNTTGTVNLPAGFYIIIVDSANPNGGAFTLNINSQ